MGAGAVASNRCGQPSFRWAAILPAGDAVPAVKARRFDGVTCMGRPNGCWMSHTDQCQCCCNDQHSGWLDSGAKGVEGDSFLLTRTFREKVLPGLGMRAGELDGLVLRLGFGGVTASGVTGQGDKLPGLPSDEKARCVNVNPRDTLCTPVSDLAWSRTEQDAGEGITLQGWENIIFEPMTPAWDPCQSRRRHIYHLGLVGMGRRRATASSSIAAAGCSSFMPELGRREFRRLLYQRQERLHPEAPHQLLPS